MAHPPNAESPLPPETVRALGAADGADVLIGIPSLNNADTIAGVVTAAEVGLRKLFPEMRAAICVSDGGSTDGTRAAAEGAGVAGDAERYLVPPASPVPRKVVFEYRGLSGKGSALHAVFECARHLGARAVAVMDADLRSVTPYWLDRLLTPVVHHGFELVAPLYVRHRHDGTITNSVAYPITSALYGARIRQPIGGEFAMTGDLALHFADADVWRTDVARFGIDLWMTTLSLVEGRRVAQSILGAKVHDPKDPSVSLGPMFRQVVGTCFSLAERYAPHWRTVREAVAPPTFGFPSAVTAEPVQVSVASLRDAFERDRPVQQGVWRDVLSPSALEATESGELDARAWIDVLYDCMAAWARGSDRRELLDALLPLYFARTATFLERTATASDAGVEAEIEALVDLAVERKPELLERWPAEAAARG